MPEQNWAQLLPYGTHTQLDPNTVIYLQTQTPELFYYLEEGRVKSVILSDDGSEKILKLHLPGMLFGEAAFFDGMPRTSTAITVTAVHLIQFNRSAIERAFSEQRELAMQLLQHMAGKVRLLSDEVGSMTFQSAHERIVEFLRSLPEENGMLHTTQEEIAAACGLSRISVSRVLRQLREDGRIQTGYRSIRLLAPQNTLP